MANPNAEMYLTPENWIPCKVLSGTLEGSSGRPKIVNWAENASEVRTGTLGYGAYMQKLVFGEAIDKSICPTGQHPSISIFSEIQVFQNTQDNSTITMPVNVIEHKNAPCNWFVGEETGLLATQFGMLRDRGNANQRWSPNPANDNGANANVNIAPYTTWAIDGMLLRIEVLPVTEWEYIGGVLFPKTSALQWRTLREWKENYSSYPICCIGFLFYGQTAKDNNTVSFANNSWIYNDNTSITACPLDDLGDYNGAPLYDYAQCAINRTYGFYLFNSYVTEPYNNTASCAYCYGLNHFDGVQIHAITDSTNGWRHCVEIPYSDKNFETIYKMAACFGMVFSDTSKYTFPADYNDNDLFIPVIGDDGISSGEYTHGTDNVTNPAAQITDIRSINYDPSANIDPNTYSNTTVFNVINAGASMNKRYLLDAANVGKLATDLFTICDTMSQNDDYSFFDNKVKANMLIQSPIDCIVSLIRYPFTPTHGSTKQTVKLGRFDASAEGYPISNAIQTITFEGKKIFPRFGNCFLDYEPYTKYEVYVPFCDTVELSAADILGHTLNVRLIVDLYTGVCTGYILADSLCIETTTGNVGVNLPLTGLDTATINANIANAESNKKAAKKNYFKGHFDIITQKDKVGAFWNQVLGTNEDVVKKADYDLKHIEAPMHTIGAASPLTSWAMDLNARIMIYYPTGDAVTDGQPPALKDLSTYAHTTGFATIDNAPLSNYTGFTVATNAILNFAATTTEKDMIENMLNGGVFI